MIDWAQASTAFGGMLALGLAGWLITLPRNNVNLVDSLWSLFFLVGALIYAFNLEPLTERAALVLILVALWALRLSLHLLKRNWGKPEDHRYQAIRRNNSPGFAWKSLFIVFGLQAVLAGVIVLPLFAAIGAATPLNSLDFLGALLLLTGLGFEALADWQLARFKTNPENKGKLLTTGLWSLTRHPNYFGDAAQWWGFYLIAASAGALWTIFSPIIMTFLLMKVSGVVMLEKALKDTKPGYADYIARTSAFFPWLPRKQ